MIRILCGHPNVPTRANSPSDVAFNSKDSGAVELTFSTSVLAATFTALNSVQPGGIHPLPGQTTLGNGPLTGQEVQINVSFASAFNLPADHYFFIPQVALTNGGQFYWLSASRPISGPGPRLFPRVSRTCKHGLAMRLSILTGCAWALTSLEAPPLPHSMPLFPSAALQLSPNHRPGSCLVWAWVDLDLLRAGVRKIMPL